MPLAQWDTGRQVSGLFRWPRSSSQMLTASRPSSAGLSWSPEQQALQGAGAARPPHSHGIIEHNILFGELQQHGIIEELADAHIFTQALWRTETDMRVSSTGLG